MIRTSLQSLQFDYALLELRKIVRSWIQRIRVPLHEPAQPEIADVRIPREPRASYDFSV